MDATQNAQCKFVLEQKRTIFCDQLVLRKLIDQVSFPKSGKIQQIGFTFKFQRSLKEIKEVTKHILKLEFWGNLFYFFLDTILEVQVQNCAAFDRNEHKEADAADVHKSTPFKFHRQVWTY